MPTPTLTSVHVCLSRSSGELYRSSNADYAGESSPPTPTSHLLCSYPDHRHCRQIVEMVATVTFDAQSVVVITGSSRGLGLEFVKQLLDTTESHVVATARDPQKADSLTALAKKQPDRLKLVSLDTGDESSIKVGPPC